MDPVRLQLAIGTMPPDRHGWCAIVLTCMVASANTMPLDATATSPLFAVINRHFGWLL